MHKFGEHGGELLPQQVEVAFGSLARIEGLHDLIVLALRVADSVELLAVRVAAPFGVDASERDQFGDLVWKNLPVELHALLGVKQAAVAFSEVLIQYGARNVEGWFPPVRFLDDVRVGAPIRRDSFIEEMRTVASRSDEIVMKFSQRESHRVFGVDVDDSLAVLNGEVVDFYETVRPWMTRAIKRFDVAVEVLRGVVGGAA